MGLRMGMFEYASYNLTLQYTLDKFGFDIISCELEMVEKNTSSSPLESSRKMAFNHHLHHWLFPRYFSFYSYFPVFLTYSLHLPSFPSKKLSMGMNAKGQPVGVYRCLFPTCQVRVVGFMSALWLLLLLLLLAGPHLPPLDRSGPRRTSSASSGTQWASLDLLPALDRSGPCRTPTASTRSLWTSPDFNRRESERCGPRRTSTGPQRPQTKPYRMPNRMSEDMTGRMSEDMPDRMSEDMPDRMSEDIPDRMSEDMPDRMPDRMSEDLPDRMSEDLQDRMSEDLPDGMPDRYARLYQIVPNRISDGINWMPWWGSLEEKYFFLQLASVHFGFWGVQGISFTSRICFPWKIAQNGIQPN